MDSKPAAILVDESKNDFDKSIVAHLSTAIAALMIDDPDYRVWFTDVRLWVNDELKYFTIEHVITMNNRVGGVILMHTIEPTGNNDDAEFVVIRFDEEGGTTVRQETLVTKERYWLDNKGLVLHQLTDYLHLS